LISSLETSVNSFKPLCVNDDKSVVVVFRMFGVVSYECITVGNVCEWECVQSFEKRVHEICKQCFNTWRWL